MSAGPQKLRLIQAGMGGMGRAWWKSAVRHSPDFELVAIVDIADEPLREAGDELQIPENRRFKSLEDAIKHVEADALLTVTPPAIHVEHARIAFAHRMHLLTEKPIADDLANAKWMVQLAKDAKRQLLVAQNYRYSPAIQKLKSLFDENRLGEFGHGHIDFYIPADFPGTFRQSMEYPLLIDMAIHHLDLIRYITGRNIARVMAQTFKPGWSWFEHDPGLKMLLELDGKIPFSYSGDWTAHGRPTTWNGNWRLQFAEGSIHLEDDKISIGHCGKWMKEPSIETIEIPEIPLTGQAALLHRFAESIRSGQPGETNGEDNLQSFAAVMAGVASAERGGAVDIAGIMSL